MEVRQNEEAFAEFRAELQHLFATAQMDLFPQGDESPSRYLDEQLGSRVREVERAISKSTVLNDMAQNATRDLVINASTLAPAVAGTLAAGATGDALLNVAGLGLAGMTSMLWSMIARPRLDGADLIFAALIRRRGPLSGL